MKLTISPFLLLHGTIMSSKSNSLRDFEFSRAQIPSLHNKINLLYQLCGLSLMTSLAIETKDDDWDVLAWTDKTVPVIYRYVTPLARRYYSHKFSAVRLHSVAR